jgi:manganese-dependent inorganic pyrophosphatase
VPSKQFVIGHRNPDADAICSAIAYANLKVRRGETAWTAARCGNSNARIDAILGRFDVPLPEFVGDVTPRVRDIMVSDILQVSPQRTISEALEIIEANDIRMLPAVEGDGRLLGAISVFQLGRFFLPKLSEPKVMRRVKSSLTHIARTLKARVHHLVNEDAIEELFVRVAAMDIRSFGKFSQQERIEPRQSVIIVGDRWDIQQRSIQVGVRLLIVTGGLDVEDDVVALAREKGVSVIGSAYDSATTAWLVRTAQPLTELLETRFSTFSPEESLADARRKVAVATVPTFFVVDENNRLTGVFTKSDLLKPVDRKLILVDHNEMSQAVAGADEVEITEILDHHRLGPVATQQPILFINEPVGSTCTIVADQFRRDGIEPEPSIAGVMMGGIISDTLHLQSPTTTPKDREILRWLSKLAGVDSKVLAEVIFNAGSVLASMAPAAVLRTDFKVYEEEGSRFAVSQIEELGFGNFHKSEAALGAALQAIVAEEKLLFACLLVTDINTQNSLLLVAGAREVIERIQYAPIDLGRLYDLPGIVSRKKQLLPYLTSLLRQARSGTQAPFAATAVEG